MIAIGVQLLAMPCGQSQKRFKCSIVTRSEGKGGRGAHATTRWDLRTNNGAGVGMTLDRFGEELRALPVDWMVLDDQIRAEGSDGREYCPILAVAVYGHGNVSFEVDYDVNAEYELAATVIGLNADAAELIVAASDRSAPVWWAPQWDSGLRQGWRPRTTSSCLDAHAHGPFGDGGTERATSAPCRFRTRLRVRPPRRFAVPRLHPSLTLGSRGKRVQFAR